MKTAFTFELTFQEYLAMKFAITDKMIELNEICKKHQSDEDLKDIYTPFLKRLNEIKEVYNAIESKEATTYWPADKFIEEYEKNLSDSRSGVEVE